MRENGFIGNNPQSRKSQISYYSLYHIHIFRAVHTYFAVCFIVRESCVTHVRMYVFIMHTYTVHILLHLCDQASRMSESTVLTDLHNLVTL